MAELFKNLYSEDFFDVLCDALSEVVADFNKASFLSGIYDSEWNTKEFKQRVHHVSAVMKQSLSDNYPESVQQILELIRVVKANGHYHRIKYAELTFIVLPDFVEQYGIDDFTISVSAFEHITEFATCEFAVRPFIIKYEVEMMKQVLMWTKHKNEHVRRLASEGSRSRLPWGMAIASFKLNPEPVMPVLEALKNDPSQYVRRSVANNLNDISKDNPQMVIDIAKKWKGTSKESDWIVKHACRSLLKAGNSEVLALFGFAAPDDIAIIELTLKNDVIHIGDDLEFSFKLCNESFKEELIRLEYAIYYMKKNGILSKKVYKISEKVYAPNSVTPIIRRQSFRPISTRRFHAGQHVLSVIINGVELEEREFELDL